jgi:hypothetical protein
LQWEDCRNLPCHNYNHVKLPSCVFQSWTLEPLEYPTSLGK